MTTYLAKHVVISIYLLKDSIGKERMILRSYAISDMLTSKLSCAIMRKCKYLFATFHSRNFDNQLLI